jgi:hypothetical protein
MPPCTLLASDVAEDDGELEEGETPAADDAEMEAGEDGEYEGAAVIVRAPRGQPLSPFVTSATSKCGMQVGVNTLAGPDVFQSQHLCSTS